MNPTASQQIIGTGCAGVATLLFLLRLQPFLWEWARKEASNDQWVTPALTILVPLWLLLMVALLCVTAGGGSDWIRLGRPMLYALTVAAALALAAVSFVFIALYIRPGFTPRGLYSPVLYLVTLSTVLVVVGSLNPKLAAAVPTQWLHRPWAWFTAFSLVVCVAVGGYWIATNGVRGVVGFAHRISNLGPASAEQLAEIAKLDPENDFESLLWRANGDAGSEVREAATARLRSHPQFLERLSSELETGHVEPALSFLRDAELSSAEQARFARPALKALQRWVDRIPASNYTTGSHLKDLKRWGTEMFRILPEKFAGTGVDFTEVIADFEFRLEQ
ncbi:MAG: hypothetical protein IPG69_12365 [Flavobacteriales bacterium]|nr:hypothetical protein [Flavobacteriales bacterium]